MTVFFILKCSGRHSKKDFLLPNRKRSFSSQLLQLPISSRTVSPELKSSCGLVAKLCLTLCNPMDHSPPGSSVHGILQARTLEWAAISSIKPLVASKSTMQARWEDQQLGKDRTTLNHDICSKAHSQEEQGFARPTSQFYFSLHPILLLPLSLHSY